MYRQSSRVTIVIRVAAALLLAASFLQVRGAPAARAAIPANAILVTEDGATSGECGTAWTSACGLSHALEAAESGDEIWVAAGTYRPGAVGNRTATFQLKSGVAIYGGFDTADDDFSQRNLSANVVTLSGDLAGDDNGFTNNNENSYNVVTGANDATLDGVTVSGGNAGTSSPNDCGGGMFNDSSSPTLTNVTFNGNSAYYDGGGMCNYNNSSPTLTNVTFSGNSVSDRGGGMCNYNNSNPTLTNVTFSGNSAGWGGGGMFNGESSPTLTTIIFSGNTANKGGGMYIRSGEPPLTNVTFSGNTATYGGGMYNGGAPRLTNVTFSGNTANKGGGMYNDEGILRVWNSILWGDSGGEIYNFDPEFAPTFTNSIVQGGYAGAINADPLLAPLGNYGGPTQTFALLPGSAAIDAGNGATCAAADARGIARPQGASCDMGAFESRGFQMGSLAGTPQGADVNTAFAAPLSLTVTANAAGEPVSGGKVTFTAPSSGASAVISGSPATIGAGGAAQVSATANGTVGAYTVTASTKGSGSAAFHLTNKAKAFRSFLPVVRK